MMAGDGNNNELAAERSRRGVLKAGLAGGVVVAAVSAPGIRGIGAIPAYASHCTQFFDLTTDKTSTSCPSECGNFINYGPANANGTYTLSGTKNGANVAATVTFSNKCSGSLQPVSIQITGGTPAGYTCTPSSVYIFQASDPNNGTTVPASNGVFPAISTAYCNTFFKLTVRCCN